MKDLEASYSNVILGIITHGDASDVIYLNYTSIAVQCSILPKILNATSSVLGFSVFVLVYKLKF